MSGSTPNRGYTYPTYQDPQDVRQAIQTLAEDVDVDMATINGEISLALNTPTVSLSRSSSQSIPTGTPTLIDWTDELYDNNAFFELADPTLITFQSTGIYWVTCTVAVAATVEAPIRDGIVEFVSDGVSTSVPSSKSLTLDEQSATYFSLMVPHIVTAGGETLSVRVTHDAAGALNAFNSRMNVSRFARLNPL